MTDELHWNPKERHSMDRDKQLTPTLLTGEKGDIIEARDGTKYRITQEGSFKKL